MGNSIQKEFQKVLSHKPPSHHPSLYPTETTRIHLHCCMHDLFSRQLYYLILLCKTVIAFLRNDHMIDHRHFQLPA